MPIDTFLKFSRDYDLDPYWIANNVWLRFLPAPNFDHGHFVEIFKVVLNDIHIRVKIIESLFEEKILWGDFSSCVDTKERFQILRRTWHIAQKSKEKAFITWQYPAIIDENGSENTHFIMLVIDPITTTITVIDSRGMNYVRNFDPSWQECEEDLRRIFNIYSWQYYNTEDIQGMHINDSFCQTWSLIMLQDFHKGAKSSIDVLQKCNKVDNVPVNDLLALKNYYSLNRIVEFWNRIVSIDGIKEEIYFNIYLQTHSAKTGERKYHHYFSTLEALANRSNEKYYKFMDYYSTSGYTFIEDFLDSIDGNKLQKILAHETIE